MVDKNEAAVQRDAWYLRPADGDLGPARSILAAWWQLASRPPTIDVARLVGAVDLLGPARRRRCVDHVMSTFSVSERFACKVLGQHRSTHRKKPIGRADDEALIANIIRLTSRYGRYGYRRITVMLRSEGWTVNAKRSERIWRREGLKVLQKQPRKGRLWLNDGSCVRLRPEHPNHVWSYDFVEGRTHNGRKFRMLNIIDEFTRECLTIRVDRKLNSTDVIDTLSDLFILRGVLGHVRSDNGPEIIAKVVREWSAAVGGKTAFIEPGSPWENGYCESFNLKLRDELLNGEIFYSLAEAKIIIEAWRRYYNTERPHSSLGYKPPALEVVVRPAPPRGAAPPSAQAIAEKPIMH